MLEYPPTSLYTTYESDKVKSGKTYYCNDKGFVWGLKVPQEIPWAVETKDIKNLYLRFASWVTGGGADLEGDTHTPYMWYDWTIGDGRFTKDTNLYVDPTKH